MAGWRLDITYRKIGRRDELGEKIASGVYFYVIKAGRFAASRKMLVLR